MLEFKEVTTVTKVPFINTRNRTHIKLVACGKTYEVWLDGVLLAGCILSSITSSTPVRNYGSTIPTYLIKLRLANGNTMQLEGENFDIEYVS
jgi:hypothetical protein